MFSANIIRRATLTQRSSLSVRNFGARNNNRTGGSGSTTGSTGSSNLWKAALFGVPLLAAAPVAYDKYKNKDQQTSNTSDDTPTAPGDARSVGTRLVDATTYMLQSKSPIRSITTHLCGIDVASENPNKQIASHYYLARLSEDFSQAVMYDSDKADAKLIGVKFIISEKLYKTLPADEQKLWSSNSFGVSSGALVAPSVPTSIEYKLMEQLAPTYGKTFGFWNESDSLPLGKPSILMAPTREGMINPQLWKQRDSTLGISNEFERQNRANMSSSGRSAGSADKSQQHEDSIVDTAMGAVSGLAGVALQKGHQLMDKASELLHETKDALMQDKNAPVKKGEEIKDSAYRKGEEIRDSASKKGQDVKDAAYRKGEEIRDSASRKGQDMKDSVYRKGEEIRDSASKKGQDVKDAAYRKGEEIRDSVSKKGQDVKDAAYRKGEEIKDSAYRKEKEMEGKAKGTMESIKSTVSKAEKNVEDKVRDVKDSAMKKGEELKDAAYRKGEQVKESAYRKGEQVKDSAVKKTEEAKNAYFGATSASYPSKNESGSSNAGPSNAKEAAKQGAQAFKEDGAVGKQFTEKGAIGGTMDKIGGPFSKDGAIGRQFTTEGAIGGTGQKVAEKVEQKLDEGNRSGYSGRKEESMKDTASRKGEELKNSAMKKGEELKDSASRKAENVRDSSMKKSDDLKNSATKKGEELKDKAAKKAENYKDSMSPSTKETVKQGAHEGRRLSKGGRDQRLCLQKGEGNGRKGEGNDGVDQVDRL
eukprot:TRINITY_DN91_c0_g1_i6.p1 TRINITY_DN91_c0_g1~~TRINITY_DN91_c0_g1_i6.p1  ORF type:complete len:759 (-),score=252.22 TRINITY_DN91_c0_g1_i6:295-2571(-)